MKSFPRSEVPDCTETIDFKTAKDINNDLVGILRALSEVTMCTEIGEEIKRRYYSYMMITAFHLEIRLC